MKKIRMAAIALCLVAALAACGGESTSTTSSGSGTATATITIADMSFGNPVTVPPGAQITIKNDATVEHSVTSDIKGQFDTHVDGQKQKTMTAPSEPGEYPFYCVYHPSMKGTLIVK